MVNLATRLIIGGILWHKPIHSKSVKALNPVHCIICISLCKKRVRTLKVQKKKNNISSYKKYEKETFIILM